MSPSLFPCHLHLQPHQSQTGQPRRFENWFFINLKNCLYWKCQKILSCQNDVIVQLTNSRTPESTSLSQALSHVCFSISHQFSSPHLPSTSIPVLSEGHLRLVALWTFTLCLYNCFALFPHCVTGCQSVFPPRHSLLCHLFSCLCSLQTTSGWWKRTRGRCKSPCSWSHGR